MLLVAQAVATIALVILVGFIARRCGALGGETTKVLADLTYWVLAPALLFHTLAAADLPAVVGRPLVIAALAGVASALFFAAIGRWVLRLNAADLTVGAMGASQNNAAYVGIPVALLVLGDAGHAIPIIVFQLGALTPTFFVLVDVVARQTRPTVRAVAAMVIRNPMVVAAATGIAVS
ncbi:MAG: AEC family transporter, partial [Actinomycetaceae bacterium]|nr:AEC family transporter [Actinomycetaceae bacterium]